MAGLTLTLRIHGCTVNAAIKDPRALAAMARSSPQAVRATLSRVVLTALSQLLLADRPTVLQ